MNYSSMRIKEIIRKLKVSASKPNDFISKLTNVTKSPVEIISDMTNLKLSKNYNNSEHVEHVEKSKVKNDKIFINSKVLNIGKKCLNLNDSCMNEKIIVKNP